MDSNEKLHQDSLKLINIKEVVSNKEYEKQLHEKKIFSLQSELDALNKSLDEKENNYKTTDYFLHLEKNKSIISDANTKKKMQIKKDKEQLKQFNSLS